ncbi:MAG: hypothetical protein JWM40_2613 [Frankiales bacterium]|nr:hypothetical protein [Frankiales bacterium]
MAGLILLVIVGAWLAVLVPMAVHRHDSAASLKSADKFGDAMRVLSRRSTRDVVVPRRPADSLVVSATRSPRPLLAEPRSTGRQLAAQRRRRTLAILGGAAWLTLVLAVVGIPGALVAHVVVDLLVVGFVVHLRKQALLRTQRRNAELRRARVPAPRRASTVEGIPARMPVRPAPIEVSLTIPAARYEDKPAVPVAATVGTGAPWSPVPVPIPTYVGKATAPRRPPRVLDLTKPGEWTATLEGEDQEIDLTADEQGLDDILDRRRAVNDW